MMKQKLEFFFCNGPSLRHIIMPKISPKKLDNFEMGFWIVLSEDCQPITINNVVNFI